jgi:Glutaredoxin-like domain (DUF836)
VTGSAHIVRLYARPGCHLCDEARAVILAEQERTGFVFEEVDVSASDELELGYGIRIPVVEVDGRELAEIRLDASELAAAVRT